MIVNSVEHKYAGNGWAVVATYPDEWTSVAYIGKGVVTQFFSAWTKLLKPETKTIKGDDGKWYKTNDPVLIEPVLLTKLQKIREDLASGKCVIRNTRLVTV